MGLRVSAQTACNTQTACTSFGRAICKEYLLITAIACAQSERLSHAPMRTAADQSHGAWKSTPMTTLLGDRPPYRDPPRLGHGVMLSVPGDSVVQNARGASPIRGATSSQQDPHNRTADTPRDSQTRLLTCNCEKSNATRKNIYTATTGRKRRYWDGLTIMAKPTSNQQGSNHGTDSCSNCQHNISSPGM